jgi:hypothetical protein
VTKKAPGLRIALALPIAALVLVVVLVPAALAGKGKGGGGGGGSTGSTGASLTFAPAAVSLGQTYQVSGSGFSPNTWVSVGAHYADTTWWNSAQTDGQGHFSVTFTATTAGQIYHEADQLGNNDRMRFMTGATLSVSP